jgi:beta-1,4-N-acetylglucosaminyltransferase
MNLLLLAQWVITQFILLIFMRALFVYRKTRYNRRNVLLRNNNGARKKQKPSLPPQSSLAPPPSPPPQQQQPPTTVPLRTLIVLGSGGHTSEILFMTQYLNHLNFNDHPQNSNESQQLFHPIFYCKATTDTTSADRLYHHLAQQQQHQQQQPNRKNDSHTATTTTTTTTTTPVAKVDIYNIPRSREVGQSYGSSIVTTLRAICYSLRLVYQLRPNCIICNGPGTCLPICIVTFLYRMCHILPNTRTYIVFVESFCRVQTLSWTGQLLYNCADVFLVHWEELQERYPNTMLTNSFLQQQESSIATTTTTTTTTTKRKTTSKKRR